MKKSIVSALVLSVVLQANSPQVESHSSNANETNTIKLTGTVVSDGQQMIGSRFMGYVKKVFVKLGDKVEREDDLYEIQSAEFDMMKMQADLMLEQSKTMVEFWRDKLKRLNTKKVRLRNTYRNDNKINFMDMADLDAEAANVETMLKTMQVIVKESNIKVKQLASTYNYIKMKAPSDGVVVRRNIRVGDMVMPGMLTIMLVDMESLEIEVSISEGVLSRVAVDQEVSIEIPSIKYKTVGVIYAIVPAINPMTHKIKMRIRFDKGETNVLPGMYAKVTI
ncbi:MAG: Probable Co/Zn/Cd efflux system membrane fusion protein [uncultured Sulfurovum sp.]|uniref:Probable Co/Zn/Cd efflux system membrane fusion protein n=1 Tax=uncultured Sulfurovum sp. TaxID=269237 RepID=A0A6S6SWD6_9BACT|nr:MAG: Probable Co/Zn/Cd efflux system membrane fusion protein [uncultured Sulfurovum sp.]